jgi:predicted PurR-regulated permease PerM
MLATDSSGARSNPAAAPSRFIPAIAFLLSIAALYLARQVLVPLALAVLSAFLLSPVVMRLQRLHVSRAPAVVIVVLFSLSLAAGIGWVVTNQLIGVVTELPAYRENIQAKLDALQGHGGGALRKAADSIREVSQYLTAPPPLNPGKPAPASSTPTPSNPVPVEVVEHQPSALQSLSNMLGPLAAPLATALMVVVFTIFMLMKQEDLRNRVITLVARHQLSTVTLLMDDAARRVSRYLLMEFSINAAFACLLSTGLHFIGVPNALLWGVLAGMLRFLPYVGTPVGGALPFLLGVVVFDGWTRPLLTLGVFLLLEVITSNAIEPWLGASRTGISPLAILVAAVFWGALWGPPGLILSTPLTVCLVVIGRYVPQLEFLYVLLGDEPVLSPEAHFYQRLLALDEQEAQSVAVAFLKERSLIDLYDVVILPVLAMAEQDRHDGALDEARAAFLVQSIGEIIGLVGDNCVENPASAGSAAALSSTNPDMRVVCLPVADDADAISAAMLSQVVERAGLPAICLPAGESPAEVVSNLAEIVRHTGDVVCISALPPFALMKAGALSKQIHARFPGLPILVGLWTFAANPRATERFGRAFSTHVVTTFADALTQIQTFAESVRPAAELS